MANPQLDTFLAEAKADPALLQRLQACDILEAIAAAAGVELSQAGWSRVPPHAPDSSVGAQRLARVVSLAVVDAGGHPLLLERRDGTSPASATAALPCSNWPPPSAHRPPPWPAACRCC